MTPSTMPDALPPIIYVSNASWRYGLPTNRQQLPCWLAKSTRVLYSSPFSLAQALRRQVPAFSYRPGLREIQPNLFLFDNLQVLPVVRGQISPLRQFDRFLITRALQRHQRKLHFAAPILWLYFPPNPSYLIGHFHESVVCYHCTDDHAGHAAMLGLDPAPVRAAERELVQAADVVFTTSRPLYDAKVRENPHTFLMPNVAEIERFAPIVTGSVAVAPELRRLPRPIAGFIGAISAYKVDLALVQQTAARLPHWSFVFVGPLGLGDGTQKTELPELPNIHFIGPRAYHELPSYLAGFDVCTIPYHLNQYTAGVFPLKFWEYLASGKPVVTTPLPALQEHFDWVWCAEEPASFARALEAAASEAPGAARARLDYAQSQSWDRRAREMLEILQSHRR